MRLSAIKLAGFKSFVEPTTLQLPSNLTSIVGPNGCGKSNVIDAVRWVTGESSAKQLRGGALEDVIFNGSKHRKPVGRASVELIFDNSDGKGGDRYSQFSEISVKRQLTRDGTATYFLNGSKCRRRDIIDLFLGTGLGGKNNYAIIEQGTVSRFIEAKPEDVRLVLEEAAGISKYKERRRETENRIRHTRENLDRLNDLRGELTERLALLERQAKNAEKFKAFKKEERRLRAELLALRRQALDEEARGLQQTLDQAESDREERQAAVRKIESEREAQRNSQQSANDQLARAQGEFYAAESELSRIDQAIRHAREMQQARETELEGIAAQKKLMLERRDQERGKAEELTRSIAQLEVQVKQAEDDEAQVRTQVISADQDAQMGLDRWENFTQDSQEPMQQAEAEKARAEQLQHRLDSLAQRIEKMEAERRKIDVKPMRDEAEKATRELAELEDKLKAAAGRLDSVDERLGGLRDQRAEAEGKLHEVRQSLQDRRGRLASLEALQQAALKEDDEELLQWVDAQPRLTGRRLAQQIEVESGWEQAVESALGEMLHALCVDDLPGMMQGTQSWPDRPLLLIDNDDAGSETRSVAPPHGAEPLAALIKGPLAIRNLASAIFAVNDDDSAQRLASSLAAGQAVVSRSGLICGPGWMHRPAESHQDGVIAREGALVALRSGLTASETQSAELQAQVESLRSQVTELENQRREDAREVDSLRHRHGELLAAQRARQVRLEQMQERMQNLETELEELCSQRQRQTTELNETKARLAEVTRSAESIAERRSALQNELRELREKLASVREEREKAGDQRRQLEITLATQTSALKASQQGLDELDARLRQLDGQESSLSSKQGVKVDPETEFKAAREKAQAAKQTAESTLTTARNALGQVESLVQDLLRRAQSAEQALEQAREKSQQSRLAFQAIEVRRQTLDEQIAETGNALKDLVESMEEGATVPGWEERLEKTERRIARLGAINLAAIDEYEEQKEREEYLIEQHADLTEALETLEEAIGKIDKETRARFKETFNHVNDEFQRLFPILFGGGEALLELTGEDLLDTGVRVMARPPGKRNSTIQLLSGGEKAMTAVALLFALFTLNPAPFCMLDEVDAPLDDANVGRFCKLVSAMSEDVQFIIITHNKLTMELAHQLNGVTMQEPGVSRLVSVDVDKAVEMVG